MTRAIALIAALATLAVAPAADAARKAPPRFMGMNWDSAISAAPPAVREAQYPRMAASGVETVRTVFSWAQAQPTEGGSIDLSATDAYVAATAARGIEVLPVVMLAPEWARLWPPAA